MKKAKCIRNPMGSHGLEGYELGELYEFQKCNHSEGVYYYRVFPTKGENYYETCGPIIFKKYFEEITKENS